MADQRAILVKHGGCPLLRYKGDVIEFEMTFGEEGEEPVLTAELDDVHLAREIADAHFPVEVDEIYTVDADDADADDGDGDTPSLAEAREDYRKAQRLAKEMDVSASGTHEEILARIEDKDEEGDIE